jgi:drug/metabolite transporter (DMT)-like permease
LEPVPQIAVLTRPWTILGWVMVTGLFGVAAAMVAIMWAATKLDPARVGVLLMAEVFVSAISAALIAGESLSWIELLGGGLVLIAGLIEVWPARSRKPVPAK